MKRTVKTEFFDHKGHPIATPVRHLAANPNSAVMRAFMNMVMNTYGASSVQVYDLETAILYASFRLSASGEIKTLVKYDPKAHKNPIYSARALFHGLK